MTQKYYTIKHLSNLIQILKNKKIILVGETHGSKQNISLLKKLILGLLRNKKAPVLLFEWGLSKRQERDLNNYLLWNISEWLPPLSLIRIKDGKFSREHKKFLVWLRKKNKFVTKNNRIIIKTFDVVNNVNKNRDAVMAKNIANIIKLDKLHYKTFLAVAGSFHSVNSQIKIDDKKYIPMRYALSKMRINVFSILILYEQGRIYNYGLKKVTDLTIQRNSEYHIFFNAIVKIKKSIPIHLDKNKTSIF